MDLKQTLIHCQKHQEELEEYVCICKDDLPLENKQQALSLIVENSKDDILLIRYPSDNTNPIHLYTYYQPVWMYNLNNCDNPAATN